jgi:hypothetical protein
VSGLQTLFARHGYDASFLSERETGLYPSSDDLSNSGEANFELCPNPWTTLFVAETGSVHLCFLSEPVGSLYEAPLVEIWNSPKAVAKRLKMIRGSYMASGCSSNWCSWREGKAAPPLDVATGVTLAAPISATPFPILDQDPVPSGLTAVRRTLTENNRRVQEMEQAVRAMDQEFQRMRRSFLVRAAAHVARRWDRLRWR